MCVACVCARAGEQMEYHYSEAKKMKMKDTTE
jgi:hypothetical protein